MQQVTLAQPGKFVMDDVPAPVVSRGQALVRTHRIGVCGTDLHAFAGRQPFFSYPRVLGHELGVEVVEVDDNDRGIVPGDRCAVEPYLACGTCIACRRGKPNCCEKIRVLGVHIDGGMRTMFTLPVEKLHKSDKLSFDQLALIETLGIGAHAVERAAVAAQETALVIGAGPIGMSVIQSLQATGASVIVADINDRRLSFCQHHLGIKHTINRQDLQFEHRLRDATGGDLPTLVMDATGHPQSMAGTFDIVAHGGRIVLVGLFQGTLSFDDPNFHKRELTLLASRNATPDTFPRLIRQMETGEIDTSPWITRRLMINDVPQQFASLAGDAELVKAMITVG